MKQYIIIRAQTWNTMEDKVNKAIREGWEPQGGVSFSMTDATANTLYVQAMTKEKQKGQSDCKPPTPEATRG